MATTPKLAEAQRHPHRLISAQEDEEDAGIKEKYARWMRAWSKLVPQGRNSLSSLQEVSLLHSSFSPSASFVPGKIAVMPTVPFMLYWYIDSDKKTKHQFNIIAAFERGKTEQDGQGIIAGKEIGKLIENKELPVDPTRTILMRIDLEEIWIVFPKVEIGHLWKKALSALLKTYYQPLEPVSPSYVVPREQKIDLKPKKTALVTDTMGLIFDISSAQDKSDDSKSYSVWTNFKVTFLRNGAFTHEEYFLFDKSQPVLESSCDEILTCVRDRLDPANLAVLQTFLQEFSMVEYEKRKKNGGMGYADQVFRDIEKPEAAALWVRIHIAE